MISTTTQASQRHTLHTNLFDSSLYQVSEPPKGVFKPSRLQYNSKPRPNIKSNRELLNDYIIKLKSKISSLLSDDMKKYMPDLDLDVTVLCLFWYVLSSISSNLTKAVLRRFPHPVALTELQFLLSASLCVSFVTLINYIQKPQIRTTKIAKALMNFPDGILPTYLNGDFKAQVIGKFLSPYKLIILTTFPMGIFQFVGHIASHNATAVIPVSLVQSVKALSPLMTVLYYKVLENKVYNPMTYYTLLLLVLGVIVTCFSTSSKKASKISVSSSSKFSGLVYAFVAMIIFVSQNIFAKNILSVKQSKSILPSGKKNETHSDDKSISPTHLDKITILFYCSCMGFLMTLPLFLTSELTCERSIFHDLTGRVFILIVSHALSHFIQALLAFQLIGMLSSVNYSVANIMKRIVIISVSLVWESKLNVMQIIGLSLTMCGLYGYDRWGVQRKNSHTHDI
ncbi:hypothetical protein TBLA_0B02850 [Henningerozyma blattae CBS 6284]|uniref:Sugar phosphate transporter domain-containing protein n=1 Tax=Henningerozyma blattae (strain ATCC 34711 / CBS 6284 / DSM 70876 / NBRC 10599 / NRRL Y-10934 / UCD 77-7) TaxID=1071380 RepID=I2GYC5_HENB6|nr:hypothetical protein TBLA_0B02850 [Tetrapisispora blattae CBS 6284]CCH59127.1 hypothetical protein TBLA_0B02850 [Tetrapisispora blattae CBS 6284]